jgi:hypothetical protein
MINTLVSPQRLVATLIAALALVMSSFAVHAGSEYGKKILSQHEVPIQVLAQIALEQKNGRGKEVMWSTPEFDARASGGPYTVVLRISGTANAAGAVRTKWWPTLGWDGQNHGALPTWLDASASAAGAPINLVLASPPQRMLMDRKVYASAEFAAASNMKIDNVVVEVWEGVGDVGTAGKLSAAIPLFTGLVFLGLVFWWRRR